MKANFGSREVRIIEKYNDLLAAAYDGATLGEFRWTPPAEAYELVLPHIKPRANVLDVGIGTGQSSAALLGAGCRICGVDISSKMLEITAKKFPAIELHQADIDQGLPFLQGRFFDLVMAIGVLEFSRNIKQTLTVLLDVLKPAGLLCFSLEEFVPGHRIQQWRESETGMGAVDPIPELLSFPTYRYTLQDIQGILQDLDLTIVESKHFEAYLKSAAKIPILYWLTLARK